MKTSNLGYSAAALAAVLAFKPANAPAAEKVVWNLSLWGAPRAGTASDEYLAKEIAKRTNGNFVIKLHYGEEISPAKANLDGIKVGAFEAADFCSGYTPGKTPVLMGLELPFLPISGYAAEVKVHEAYANTPEANAELAHWGAMFYSPHALPQDEFLGTGDPPRKLEDWSGRRVRALGGIGDAMRKLGAVPTSMPAPEIYTAMERGTIDAVALPFTYAFASYRIDELSKWYTANMHVGATGCHTVFAKAAFDKLPEEYKKLLAAIEPDSMKAQGEAYKAADEVNLAKWKKAGLAEIRYSDAELERLREVAAKPIWQAWVAEMNGKGFPGQKLLDTILDKAKQFEGAS